MSPLSVEQLPDDVVVEVLRRLSVDDVLACRLVCRRLGTLSLHRDVWRRRRIVDDDKPCVCAVLRLAPCLDVISVSRMQHLSGFETTRCAAAKLVIDVEPEVHPAVYALAVRNQEALGRLRHVAMIADDCDGGAQVGADSLLKTLAAASRLESLDMTHFNASKGRRMPCARVPSESSLKIFRCALSAASEPFVNAVLAGHAATLEEVKLGGGHNQWDKVDLLASMPNLGYLSCDMLPGLEALAACKRLTHMELYLEDSPSYEPLMDGAVRFLRRADQLRAVTINFSSLQRYRRLCEKLVDALASRRRPLKQLHVGGLPDVQLLLGVLPRLPSLRHLLVLDVMGACLLHDDLLLGITPTSAPALRRLELADEQVGADGGMVCGYTWLHGDAVKAALAANPALHILLHDPRSCERPDCAACAQGCHQQVSWNEDDGRLVVFSHDPANCPSPTEHVADRDLLTVVGRGSMYNATLPDSCSFPFGCPYCLLIVNTMLNKLGLLKLSSFSIFSSNEGS